MITVYKILNDYESFLKYSVYVFINSVTREHNFNLKKATLLNPKKTAFSTNGFVNFGNSHS